MSKPTLGPWVQDSRERGVIRAEGQPVIGAPLSGCYQICAVTPVSRTPGADANARLIAAAPDLLEACRLMVDITGGSVHWNGETNRALKAIEAAISKAEGREVTRG